ncbi:MULTISPECIES: DJ-1/PfpI family protein [Clostridium]|uniref:DJ-1/PfpI family protein n=1 Tax=Clostridium TaxID=1485 RepID=UPI0013E95AFF|nr:MULTISPECIES: DJ-1/PfpI family protein [Clostridium]MBW9156189.1 DJ-1/PfpI family protein [Clostridium tagluense]MBZ9637227.1 DJ-1/PfpI family protein [Clostridium sp. FP1]WLC65572.1 DJ-1/PfpI family protein [Clostridium tagluense]
MNVCVLYYDGFCEFEVVFAFAKFRNNIFSVALENRVYISEENQKYLPDKTIQQLNPDDIDLFIIPGGNPVQLYEKTELKEFMLKLNEKNKFIAGICGGTELMAYYGLLDNKEANGDGEGFRVDESNKHIYEKVIIVDKDVVRDGNCITSIGQAFIEFSIELGKVMNIYKNDEEIKDDYNWLKNIKDKK